MNESNLKFTVNNEGNIRLGLAAVTGVGDGAVQSIMEEREKLSLIHISRMKTARWCWMRMPPMPR